MSGWTIGVLICCFIVALLLLGHYELLTLTLSRGCSPFVILLHVAAFAILSSKICDLRCRVLELGARECNVGPADKRPEIAPTLAPTVFR